MRRVASVVTGLALTTGLTALGAPALATAPTRGPEIIKSTVNELSCAFRTADGAGIQFTTSYRVGVDRPEAGAVVESDGPELSGQGPLTWGPTLTSTVPLVTEDGRPAGTFAITATLVAGPTRTEKVDEWDGNLHTTGTMTSTEQTITVRTVSLTGTTVVGGTCSGSTMTWDLKNNNPQYHRTQSTELASDPCTLKGIEPSQIWVRGDVRKPRFTVVVHRGATLFRGTGELKVKRSKASTRTALVNRTTEKPQGSVKVGLRLSKAGKAVTRRSVEGATTTTVTRTPYRMRLKVTTSVGEVGRVTCRSEKVAVRTVTKRW